MDDRNVGVLGGQAAEHRSPREHTAGGASPFGAFGSFGPLALILATVGLYGLLSHRINQERRSIAIVYVIGMAALSGVGSWSANLPARRAALWNLPMHFAGISGLAPGRLPPQN